MPASLPGATLAQNLANPDQGAFVIFNPLSGPKGSPLDRDNPGNCSTGALSTGIGYGAWVIGPTAPGSIKAAGFDADEVPGGHNPAMVPTVGIMFIGGGRSLPNGDPYPYTAGVPMHGAGNGGSRDGGAGPAFTSFAMKIVTATGPVAQGALIDATYVNRSGRALVAGETTIGSASGPTVAPTP